MIDEVIAQLKAYTSVFKDDLIGGAADIPAAEDEVYEEYLPSCYVIPMGETGEEPKAEGFAYPFELTEAFAVFVTVSNIGDETGNLGHQALKPIKAAIFKAILGFIPVGYSEPVRFTGGQLIANGRAFLMYEYNFSVTRWITKADCYVPEATDKFRTLQGLKETGHGLDHTGDGEADAQFIVNVPQDP